MCQWYESATKLQIILTVKMIPTVLKLVMIKDSLEDKNNSTAIGRDYKKYVVLIIRIPRTVSMTIILKS